MEHSHLALINPKTPEATKKAVQDVRRDARPSIESSITDKEILAVFAICEAFDAIRNIQQGKPEEVIKEKVLSASMLLELAKNGFEPEKQSNEIVFFDDQTRYLWIDKDRKCLLENQDAEVLKAILNIISVERLQVCRKEEILLAVYKKEIGTTQKLPARESRKLNSAISTINKKGNQLGVGKLIASNGVRMLKLTRQIDMHSL